MKEHHGIAIVGNGCAAAECVKALRENGYCGSIGLFSDNDFPPYNPMLTTYYVAGKIGYDQMFPYGSGQSFYDKYDVRVYPKAAVVAVNAAEKLLANKAEVTSSYGKCLIATGAGPILPPLPGIDSRGVFAMRTVDDAVVLKQAMEKSPRKAIVVGASMIGIKLVELFHAAGMKVCLADMANHLFPLAAHPDCAEVMERRLLDRGIRLRLGAPIQSIEETPAGVRAHFKDGGAPEEGDLLLMCIGVRPNMSFIDRSQVTTDKGILVDENMRTNAEGLYAAGDVAQGKNLLTGENRLIGLWANARYQGRAAGRHMAGRPTPHPGNVPHNITHFMDIVFAGIGDTCDSDAETKIEDGSRYVHLFWKKGRLTGANLIDCSVEAGILRRILLKDLIPGRAQERQVFEMLEPFWQQNRKHYFFSK